MLALAPPKGRRFSDMSCHVHTCTAQLLITSQCNSIKAVEFYTPYKYMYLKAIQEGTQLAIE